MVSLRDRLDYIVGAKAADPLDEVFGIRTVDDLLRHYPRSYTEGATRWGADGERPPAGEHITIVDTIADTESFPMKKNRKKMCLRITVGSGRSKVTATFFNANYIMKDLTKGTKVMLSGEVGFFKNVMQLTHPAFLILDSPDGKNIRHQVTEKHRQRLASHHRRGADVGFPTSLLPDLSGQHEGAELGHLRLRASSSRRPRPGARSVAR